MFQSAQAESNSHYFFFFIARSLQSSHSRKQRTKNRIIHASHVVMEAGNKEYHAIGEIQAVVEDLAVSIHVDFVAVRPIIQTMDIASGE